MLDEIRVQLDEGAIMPTRAHEWDAGMDIYTPYGFEIKALEWAYWATIDTGVHIEIPKGYVGLLKSKSGLNVKNGITGEGVIDAGYTGSVVVKLYCNASKGKSFERGDKIIQLLIVPVATPKPVLVDKIDGGDRGNNGFGSSGR